MACTMYDFNVHVLVNSTGLLTKTGVKIETSDKPVMAPSSDSKHSSCQLSVPTSRPCAAYPSAHDNPDTDNLHETPERLGNLHTNCCTEQRACDTISVSTGNAPLPQANRVAHRRPQPSRACKMNPHETFIRIEASDAPFPYRTSAETPDWKGPRCVTDAQAICLVGVEAVFSAQKSL